MATLEQLAAFWNEEGLSHVIPEVGGEFPEGFDVRAMLGQIIDERDGVLEVGCGYGRLCRAFAPEHYLGVDVNVSAVAAARSNHPGYRFECIEPGAELPRTGTALIYTVACHIPDGELARFLAPICTAAERVVIAEVMDERWRRDGNPPIFNRDPEAYVGAMLRQGFELERYGKAVYQRYDVPAFNVGRDVRLTVHVYRRAQ
ncbi:class I SAM-dependent methyltransferase [Pseudomonas sp. GCEP-101]|uniref:class I SAM-dependent methyltransferase n=1 Tax=Pseudomonas sp. GCEP-101 TaxID=2974552 RepID=UPI00223AD96A|nr:class I SAM-dependent methyltransferase [Pseudomonas sp. GCEP-101]